MEVEWLVSRAGERGVRPCPQRGSEQAEVSVAFALRFLGGKELLVKADEMEWITTRRVVQRCAGSPGGSERAGTGAAHRRACGPSAVSLSGGPGGGGCSAVCVGFAAAVEV